jgi:hypothetical protein
MKIRKWRFLHFRHSFAPVCGPIKPQKSLSAFLPIVTKLSFVKIRGALLYGHALTKPADVRRKNFSANPEAMVQNPYSMEGSLINHQKVNRREFEAFCNLFPIFFRLIGPSAEHE